jgi:all-trans-retinol 13,14-reductase
MFLEISTLLLALYFFYKTKSGKYAYSDFPMTMIDSTFDYTKNRYSSNKIPDNIDTIIIGSGISGLTVGSILSKAHQKVLILEQHDIAGGTTHSFEDKGIEHETGIHYVGNIPKYQKILDSLTDKPIQWCKMGHENPDKEIYDEIIINDKIYTFPSGEKNLIQYLTDLFPHEKEGIANYFSLIKYVSKRGLFYYLKAFPYKFVGKFISYIDSSYSKYVNKTVNEVIHELVSDTELRAVLTGQFGDYGILPSEACFYLHASIVNHYLNGGYFPLGGTSHIANEFIKSIKKHNGEVLVGKGVNEILITNNKACGVLMNNGDTIYAKNVVSSVGIKNTFEKLVTPEYVPEEYHTILDNIPVSTQHIYCFIKLKGTPEELGLRSSNLWIYPNRDYDKVFEDYFNDPLEAPMPLFMGFSCKKDTTWNERFPGYSNAIILTTAKKEWFNEWEHQKCNSRSKDYKEYKKLFGEKMINEGLYKYFPKTEGKVLDFDVGTPLTTQYYLNSVEGESYGLESNKYKLLDAYQIRPRTEIDNLFLTGQDVCTIGFVGGLMSGVITGNVMLEYDNLYDIIMGNNVIKDII